MEGNQISLLKHGPLGDIFMLKRVTNNMVIVVHSLRFTWGKYMFLALKLFNAQKNVRAVTKIVAALRPYPDYQLSK